MAEFKRVSGGVNKEVVKEYTSRGDGVVLPSAYEDDFGGRPDLVHGTKLPKPIDDPSFETLLDGYARNRDAVSSPESNVAKEVRIDPDVSRTPFVPLPTSGTPKAAEKCAAPAEAENSQISELVDEIMKNPAKLSEFIDLHAGQPRAKNAPPPPASEQSYVQVTMEGPFGRFRSKAADVIICENHIALLYTGGAGDDDLAYEPPSNVVVTLKVPMNDDNVRTFDVVHFGLTTKIPNVGTLVVLPKSENSNPNEAVDADQEEYSL